MNDLLTLARHTLDTLYAPKPEPNVSLPNTPTALFVTLKKNGQLRGCIGTLTPQLPLPEAIRHYTRKAALNDPRFPPVTEQELPEISIELSILTPQTEINSCKEIVLGKHGIVLEKFGKSAVFLPQVPIEQNWNLETTLNALSQKADLPQNAWQHDCKFYVFEAIKSA